MTGCASISAGHALPTGIGPGTTETDAKFN